PADLHALPLHDALPISTSGTDFRHHSRHTRQPRRRAMTPDPHDPLLAAYRDAYHEGRAAYRAGRDASECPYKRNRRMAESWLHRSEEHTSELQSRENLV